MHLCLRALPALVFLLAASCFDDTVPDDALILCRDDGECPAGWKCAQARHECVLPGSDQDPPTLTAILFEPAASNGDPVRLSLVASEPLATDRAPLVRFSGLVVPELGPPAGEQNSRSFVIETDPLPDGIYLVAEVELTDVAGNHAKIPVDGAALEVDRRPPGIQEARLVDGPPDGIYADIDSGPTVRTRLTVEFMVDDMLDLAATVVHVGALRSQHCEQVAALAGTHRCTVALDSPLTDDDDDAPVLVQAFDTAGNLGERVLFAHVDAAPPAVASAAITIQAPGIGPIAAALPGSRVQVALVASEALVSGPVGHLRVGSDAIPFVTDGGAGQSWQLSADIARSYAGSIGVVELALTDLVGHASAAVELADPVPFGNAIMSPCQVPAAIGCPDADGDGISPVLGCNTAADCNDIDATVFPGAPEIPGDGVANDCDGLDLPIDETTGVFLDSAASTNGVGTRQSPFNQSIDAENSGASYVFVRQGSTFNDRDHVVRQSVIGGLGADWLPVANGRSNLAFPVDNHLYVASGLVLQRVNVDTNPGYDLIPLDRVLAVALSSNDRVWVEGSIILVRADLQGVIINDAAVGRIIDSEIGGLSARGTLHLVRTEVDSSTDVAPAASLFAVSSYFHSGWTDPVIRCNYCSVLSLSHCTLFQARTGTPAVPVVVNESGGTITIINSVLHAVVGGPLLDVTSGGGSWRLVNNALSQQSLVRDLVARDGTTLFDDVAALNSCDEAGGQTWCQWIMDNRFIGPPGSIGFVPGDLPHIELASPLHDAALPQADMDSALLDFDRECRFWDAAADIGADEVHGG